MPKKVNAKDLEAAGRKVAHIIRHTGGLSFFVLNIPLNETIYVLEEKTMPKKVNAKDLEAAGRKVAHIIRHTGCMSEVEDGATKKDRHEAMRAEAFGTGYRDGFVAQRKRIVTRPCALKRLAPATAMDSSPESFSYLGHPSSTCLVSLTPPRLSWVPMRGYWPQTSANTWTRTVAINSLPLRGFPSPIRKRYTRAGLDESPKTLCRSWSFRSALHLRSLQRW